MMALTKWTAAESVDQKVRMTKMAAQMAHLLVTQTEMSLASLTEMRTVHQTELPMETKWASQTALSKSRAM